MGICETEHEGDWEAVHQVLGYLGTLHRERQIVRLVRLGKRHRNKIRPIKMIFDHKAAAREIMDKGPRLAHSRIFEMVYLKKDLPLGQRMNKSFQQNAMAEAARGSNMRQGSEIRLPTFENVDERYVNPNNLLVVPLVDNSGNDFDGGRQSPQQ